MIFTTRVMLEIRRRRYLTLGARNDGAQSVCRLRAGAGEPQARKHKEMERRHHADRAQHVGHHGTWAMASTSRMLARNWLPRPSPLEAPFTRPAMSTNSSWVLTILAELAMAASLSSRKSGTATRPTLGSMVQNG